MPILVRRHLYIEMVPRVQYIKEKNLYWLLFAIGKVINKLTIGWHTYNHQLYQESYERGTKFYTNNIEKIFVISVKINLLSFLQLPGPIFRQSNGYKYWHISSLTIFQDIVHKTTYFSFRTCLQSSMPSPVNGRPNSVNCAVWTEFCFQSTPIKLY